MLICWYILKILKTHGRPIFRSTIYYTWTSRSSWSHPSPTNVFKDASAMSCTYFIVCIKILKLFP